MSLLATKLLPHSKETIQCLSSCNQWCFPINSHQPENAPFELLLSICLAQISLTYRSCAVLLIYRINRMYYRAIIHLLCSELSAPVSSHSAWVRCRTAWHRCWGDGFALQGAVRIPTLSRVF